MKHLARIAVSNVDKKAVDDERPIRLCNYTDVYYNERITASLDFMAATASESQIRDFRLRSGDVLITKDSETPDDIAVPALVEEGADDLVCGYHLALIRADETLIDPRFLFWTLASTSARSWFSSQATGVTRFGLRAQSIGDARISLPPLSAQAETADYLGRETRRIDALIEKKRRMQNLLGEREQAALLGEFGDWRGSGSRTLRQYGASVVTGPFGTQLQAAEYVSGGIPVINPTHISRGRLVPEDEVSVPEAVAERLARHRLRAGDIVMGRKGDVGRSAVIGRASQGWLCGSDSIAIRVDSAKLSPEWLALLLHVDLYRQQLVANSTGAMVAGINESILMNMRLPDVPVGEQRLAAMKGQCAMARFDELGGRLERQIALLREHRQALITAAVTGQREIVSRASTRSRSSGGSPSPDAYVPASIPSPR